MSAEPTSVRIKSTWRWGGLLLLALLSASLGIRRLLAPASRNDGVPPSAPPPAAALTAAAAAGAGTAHPAPVGPEESTPAPAEGQTPGVPAAFTPPSAAGAGTAHPAPVGPEESTPTPVKIRMLGGPGEEPGQHRLRVEWNLPWIADLRARIAADPLNAFAYCRSLPPDQQVTALHMLFSVWARRDPEAAFRAAQGLTDDLRQAMVAQTLSLWALVNPEAALARLASAHGLPADVRSHIALRAISEIGRRDPMAAMEVLAETDLQDAPARDRLTAELLGRWIAMHGTAALVWLRDSDVDEATYDRAIVAAIEQMAGPRREDAAALFAEFVATGRMDHMADPALYSQTVSAAKALGATLGATDYPSALEWGFELPADSAARAYVLSNVAYSQTHGPALPDMPWIAEMEPGFARARVVAAVTYGRLVATGDRALNPEVKRQLDIDEFDPARLKVIVQQSTLPADEKTILLSLL